MAGGGADADPAAAAWTQPPPWWRRRRVGVRRPAAAERTAWKRIRRPEVAPPWTTHTHTQVQTHTHTRAHTREQKQHDHDHDHDENYEINRDADFRARNSHAWSKQRGLREACLAKCSDQKRAKTHALWSMCVCVCCGLARLLLLCCCCVTTKGRGVDCPDGENWRRDGGVTYRGYCAARKHNMHQLTDECVCVLRRA